MTGWYDAPEGTPTDVAKGYVQELLGDEEASAPPAFGQRFRKPYWHYFAILPPDSSRTERDQIAQLPIQDRERDLIERMGLDGRVA